MELEGLTSVGLVILFCVREDYDESKRKSALVDPAAH